MRMRRKPWARPELAACPYYIDTPAQLKGAWNSSFANPTAPLEVELGCGKGYFIAEYGSDHPEKNLIAIDIKSEVLAVARRQIQASYAAKGVEQGNIRLFSYEIELIAEVFGEGDCIDALYINFPNPWPKAPHHKKRLTHPKQLIGYLSALRDGGKIHFKTDDDGLFEDSLEYLMACGFHLETVIADLPLETFGERYATEHERMFRAANKPIKYCVAVNHKPVTDKAVAALLAANPKLLNKRPERFIK